MRRPTRTVDAIRADLEEVRRRLGPYTALQGSGEPYRLNDAEIARRVSELLALTLELAAKIETLEEAAR